MLKEKTMRLLLCLLLMMTGAVVTLHAQNKGQVTVEAPGGLLKRNNADLNKKQDNTDKKQDKKGGTSATGEKKGDGKQRVDPDDKVEKINELDDDRPDTNSDKEEKKKEETTKPVKPKRNYTTQQTIQSRTVGYRIQAYADNNTRTAKAKAQQRARDIAMKFPQYRSYITNKGPTWRLRIGDFKSRQEAQAALHRIKKELPKFAREMTIVRDRINVWGND